MTVSKDYQRKYREEHKEQMKEYQKRYREKHKEEMKEYMQEYRKRNREHINAYMREYLRKNRDAHIKRVNDYHQTKKGRAMNLLTSYVQMDIERRNGQRPDLTQEDIMRICMSDDSKCVYCGETDWRKLGLDRINGDLPHHAWNCVCSCHNCNVKRYKQDWGEYIVNKCGSWEQFAQQNGINDKPRYVTIRHRITDVN